MAGQVRSDSDAGPERGPGLDAEAESAGRADAVIEWLRSYARDRLNSVLIDERRCIPPYVVIDFGNRGLLGLQSDPRFGGLGLGNVDGGRVIAQLAAIDLTLATFVGIHNSLGLRPIEKFARAEVRDELVPLLASGRMLGGLAITEPAAGSNPRAMQTIATPCDGGWILDGRKSWIGNGSWSGVLNVFSKVRATGSRAGLEADGFLACVVRQGTTGVSMGPEALTMGLRGVVQNEVKLEGVRVAERDVLGEPGEGFGIAEDSFLTARLGIACMCVGAMRRCAQLMTRYASRRSIISGRLLDNPVTIRRVTAVICATECTDALTRTVAAALDAGQSVPTGLFIACKMAGPEFLGSAADTLIQVLGGRGYIETNYAPQLYRDARLLRIFEGPTETMAAYLGSLIVNWGRKYEQYIQGRLRNPAVARTLMETSKELWQRPRATEDPSEVYAAIGNLAMRALLYACVADRSAGRPERIELQLATTWARAEYEDAIARARALERTAPPSAETLAQLVEQYEESIGDAQQSLPGADYTLDALLRVRSTSAP